MQGPSVEQLINWDSEQGVEEEKKEEEKHQQSHQQNPSSTEKSVPKYQSKAMVVDNSKEASVQKSAGSSGLFENRSYIAITSSTGFCPGSTSQLMQPQDLGSSTQANPLDENCITALSQRFPGVSREKLQQMLAMVANMNFEAPLAMQNNSTMKRLVEWNSEVQLDIQKITGRKDFQCASKSRLTTKSLTQFEKDEVIRLKVAELLTGKKLSSDQAKVQAEKELTEWNLKFTIVREVRDEKYEVWYSYQMTLN